MSSTPADAIQEALKRLLDRRYIVAARAPGGPAAAYWASIGLPPSAAESETVPRNRCGP